MKALVVYDSVFGNTEKIALSIQQALNGRSVRAKEFVPQMLDGVGLLVVGSPTRAFRPTPELALVLKKLPADSLRGMKAASFDTGFSLKEIDIPFLKLMASWFGYAAKPIAKILKKKGAELAAAPEGFFVTGTEGPLKEGEIKRAAEWANKLAK
jgi:flavodoxin